MSAPADFGPFAGKVIIEADRKNKHQAAKDYAAAASAPATAPPASSSLLFGARLVSFSDGSAAPRADDLSQRTRWTSASAVWRVSPTDEFAQRGWPSPYIPGSAAAELFADGCNLLNALEVVEGILNPSPKDQEYAAAVAAAFGTTTTTTNSAPPPPPPGSFAAAVLAANASSTATTTEAAAPDPPTTPVVEVLSDCKNVLAIIRDLRPGGRLPKKLDVDLLRWVFSLAARLTALGVLVVLRWTPGHVGVPGNELADSVARAHRPDVIDPGRFPPARSKRRKRGSG
ncbi:uncharacterized protein LTHEOB_825 [Lasiodiplodia theobromae]|uniref:uncharacterized protein n=1 Tax=Lasiodiplodia theobromae TaxID=45133 RepID=UPI0015C33D28|nr:uncharacterized protein LTHEOB_825 [Lasiodiplodia theobromae]KAF4540883.1 hypothetical protein LTHEOB_825 [Lasiodiplodia theobromae]